MNKDIAIIGMAARFPDANDLHAFYNNLCAGRDSVRKPSLKRLIQTTIPPYTDYQPGAYFDQVDQFDHVFFGISKSEAENMDPAQRLLMEVVYECFEDAGYNPDELYGSRTAVFMGDTKLKYYEHAEKYDPTLLTGNMNAATAGRISRFFNLRGNALMIDTTCSSSLVALHYAIRELNNGEADHALVCGLNIILFPNESSANDGIGIFSPEGKARTFDATANGTGIGEAVACVMLKPLQQALADNDIIHAIIKGSAVNQDAALSGTLTAPSRIAQTEVIQSAWKQAQIEPATISYIEAHGTGTKLGDPIEVEGIDAAFRDYTDKKHFCAISSVKTNIGHTDTAAGIAGFIKTVLALKYKKYFPTVHFNSPNPLIDFKNSAVYVSDKLQNWEPNGAQVRRAGVSSFGLIGTNCHLVLEEAPQQKAKHGGDSPGQKTAPSYLIMLSAQDSKRLLDQQRQWISFLRKDDSPQLCDISYTLATGRKHFSHRFVTIVSTKAELLERLLSFNQIDQLWVNRRAANEDSNLVFTFSDGTVISDELLEEYRSCYPVFNKYAGICEQYLAGSVANKSYRLFAFQYSFYHLLQEYGITTRTLTGDGLGKITVDVITGRTKLEEAVQLALAFNTNNKKNIQPQCRKMIDGFAGRRTVFAEVGPAGSIVDCLNDIKTAADDFTTVSTCNDVQEVMLQYGKQLYLWHAPVNWKNFGKQSGGRKADLPHYSFKKIRCWIKEPVMHYADNWLYRLQWVEQKLDSEMLFPSGKKYLVVGSEDVFQNALVNLLKQYNNQVVEVLNDLQFYQDVRQLHADVDGIIYINNTSAIQELPYNHADALLQFSKTFSDWFERKGFHLVMVNTTDSNSDTNAALSTAWLKVIMSSYTQLVINAVDVDSETSQAARQVLQEMGGSEMVRIASYINGKRFVQQLRSQRPIKHINASAFAAGNVYIISGGIGGLGLELCEFIAKQYPSRFILLGRSELPARNKWASIKDSRLSAITEKWWYLENIESSLEYYRVDVADAEAMEKLFAQLKLRYKKIHGVIHAAGLPIDHTSLQELAPDDLKALVCAKWDGTLILDRLCQEFQPDFFVNFSSLNTVFPQRNSFFYTLANTWQNIFAFNKIGKSPTRYYSINWPGWSAVGMSADRLQDENVDDIMRLLQPADGVETFGRIIGSDEGVILVADLDKSRMSTNPFFEFAAEPEISEESAHVIPAPGIIVPADTQSGFSSTEQLIIHIWNEVLKTQSIKPTDDFFKLGGHSLNGTQVINRIRRETAIELEMEDLFQYTTVEQLTARVNELLAEKKGIEQPAILPIEDQEYYPVSHAQKRLWISSRLGQSAAYNIFSAYILKGGLNISSLNKAFNVLLDRHQSLRTGFAEINNEPVQFVRAVSDFSLEHIDITNVANKPSYIHNAIQKQAVKPFDLENDLLIRGTVLQTETDEYILLLTIHHIVSDGWSEKIMLSELLSLYNNYNNGGSNTLPPLKLQYKDFAIWHLLKLQDENAAYHRNYWLKKFEGEIPVLLFPSDFARPKVKTFEGCILESVCGERFTNSLQEFCQKKQASLFTVLFAAVNVLLWKYTHQKDIILGTPIAGRDHLDLEGQIGIYVNTLALRTRIDEEEYFGELLNRVKQDISEASGHQAYPFDLLIEELQLVRTPDRSPLFDIMVVMHDAVDEKNNAGLNGLEVSTYPATSVTAKFDLSFNFILLDQKLCVSVEYNTSLYKQERITSLLKNFETLLADIVRDERKPLKKTDCIDEKEKQVLLAQSRGCTADYPSDKTLQQLFEVQAAKRPDAIAVVFNNRHLTYEELNCKANQLAYHLTRHYSVKKGHLVGVMVERSEKMIISLLGILKAGAAYIPIDPDYPEERIAFTIADAAIKVLIADNGRQIVKIMHEDVRFLTLDDSWDMIINNPCGNLNIKCDPSDLAYVIYTSGSTGNPKGAMLEHRGVVNRIDWMWKAYHFTEADIILQKTPFVFDVSVWEFFLTVCYGATMVVCRKDDVYEPLLLCDLIEKQAVTTIHFVPGMYSVFLEALRSKLVTKLSSLRHVFVSGEALPSQTGKKHYEKLNIPLHNLYGPTEASVDVSYYEVNGKEDIIPIGKPITNIDLYILDANMQLVPAGVEGEICIGGIGLARGYLNRPQLSSERFVPNPFINNERLYKTGDIGRWNAEGNIEYSGRMDDQIKIRGHRIELGEIESKLLTLDGIENAVVLAKKQEAETELICFYTGKNIRLTLMRTLLSNKLPHFMIPSCFVWLEKMPVTSTGKINRRALLQLPVKPLHTEREVDAGSSELEKLLLDICCETLRRDSLSMNDNFFEIGGDSIKAMQIATRLYNHGYKIEVRDILREPILKSLVDLIQPLTRIADQGIIEGDVELTPVQYDFFERGLQSLHYFNQAVMLYKPGNFDKEIMEEILIKLSEHHDALRLTFAMKDGRPRQYMHGNMHTVSYTFYDGQSGDDEIETIVNKVQASFDLEQGPLFKMVQICGRNGHYLLLIAHHLVIDAVSWRILLEDISLLLSQHKNGQTRSLPLKTDSYKAWSAGLLSYATSKKLIAEYEYWYKILTLPVQNIPVDTATKHNRYGDTGSKSFELSIEETMNLTTRVNEIFGTDITDILLAALMLATKERFGLKSIALDVEGHGRESILEGVDVSRTVGWFTSIFPVVLAVPDNNDLGSLIRQTKDTMHGIPERGIGFGILKYLCNDALIDRSIFDHRSEICFNYLGQFDNKPGDESEITIIDKVGHVVDQGEERRYLLEITALIREGRLVLLLMYNRHQFDEPTIEQFLGSYEVGLRRIMEYCISRNAKELTLSDLSYTSLPTEDFEQIRSLFQK